jgi:hypothetical protein
LRKTCSNSDLPLLLITRLTDMDGLSSCSSLVLEKAELLKRLNRDRIPNVFLVWTPPSHCGANSAAPVGTLGVAATGVNPVRYHACHSQHVTDCLHDEGETFTCLHLKQEVTLKHLASQDSRHLYQKTANKTSIVSTI